MKKMQSYNSFALALARSHTTNHLFAPTYYQYSNNRDDTPSPLS